MRRFLTHQANWAATFHLRGYKSLLLIFVYHNPPNSDMECRIVCVRIYLFVSEKLKDFLVLLTGFEPSTFGSPVQRSNH